MGITESRPVSAGVSPGATVSNGIRPGGARADHAAAAPAATEQPLLFDFDRACVKAGDTFVITRAPLGLRGTAHIDAFDGAHATIRANVGPLGFRRELAVDIARTDAGTGMATIVIRDSDGIQPARQFRAETLERNRSSFREHRADSRDGRVATIDARTCGSLAVTTSIISGRPVTLQFTKQQSQ